MNKVDVGTLLHGARAQCGRVQYAIDERDWNPMKIGDSLLPCFWWIPVANDESGAWQSYWMRMDPGARSPQHIHESTELLLVTQGVFTDGDNESYGPGEIVVYAAGSDHSSYSTEGCIALVVTRTSSRLLK